MASTEYDSRSRGGQEVSGWAVGGLVFAASILILIGVFQIIAGLVAVFNDEFFVVARNYTFHHDVTAWGWLHLIFGVLMVVVGMGLFGRRSWAAVAGLMLAMLSAVLNFFFIPYYPLWAIVVIALDVWVIWALTRPGVVES